MNLSAVDAKLWAGKEPLKTKSSFYMCKINTLTYHNAFINKPDRDALPGHVCGNTHRLASYLYMDLRSRSVKQPQVPELLNGEPWMLLDKGGRWHGKRQYAVSLR